ncbi:RNA polymerase factor sigma-54 [Lutibacter sp.]|uniref:RNA polymerase factor sigma-54 n=1 Tax=Lutibacter sp. TaxID=1925666 RepID=UPI002734EEF7|nr:RNA polymerase factor sigma-54 [Lutibacter sp.]MDP3313595.1 RNA polymerase factor sigma-54 [Lutibacter sp.]
MLRQSLHQKLQQKLSPQQIQLMKMIQLPTQEFEQRLKQELEENPALENADENEDFDEFSSTSTEDEYDDSGTESIDAQDINIDEYLSDDEIPNYKTQSNNYAEDDEDKHVPYASGTSFTQHLKSQINTFTLTEEEELITDFLIGSIDDSGYIRRDLADVLDDLAFTQNIYTTEKELERLLKVVQQLEPSGVGARDLKECLIIQLKNKKEKESRNLAIAILENSFDHFVKKHYTKLTQKYNITEVKLKEAIQQIEKLNPKPGGSFVGSNKFAEQIVPDFSIKIIEGELELTLNSRNAPELHISKEYNNLLSGYKESNTKSKSQQDAVQFIKQKLDAAKWFIDAIKQRQQTLLLNMNAIMRHQKEYFLSGDERKLKPMILKDIADAISMDVSTVSRVANSKYVSTPYGTKLIKEFFSESMKNDQGEDVSTIEIKNILSTVINEESKRKPLTDDKLATILLDKGYPIARRTVAKYREQLDIPVARLRKEI